VVAILVAFLPAAVIGVLAHGFVTAVLFESPWLVCVTLIVRGVLLLAVDRMVLKPRYHDAMEFSLPTALTVGFCPVPGHGAGRLALGIDDRRRLVARRGQALRDRVLLLSGHADQGGRVHLRSLHKNYASLAVDDVKAIALGFVVSFAAGVVVVHYLLDYVSRYGFALFAWWRILAGAMALGALAVLG
jgi:undecaprenyl-diphosphatase